jgi:hypothetical protein
VEGKDYSIGADGKARFLSDAYGPLPPGAVAPVPIPAPISGPSSITQSEATSGVINNQEGKLPADSRGARATPFKTNSPGERSPLAYQEVLNSFDVENTTRYQELNGESYCNIFVWDATCAMGAEIPHYIDPKTGVPKEKFETGDQYQSANDMYHWLDKHGTEYGWNNITAEEAIIRANAGYPTVAVNKGTVHGHIAMVVPQKDGDTAVMTAQAGIKNYNYGGLSSNLKKEGVRYYTHD